MTTPFGRNFRTLIQAGTTAVRQGDIHEALGLFQQAAALAGDDGQAAEAGCMIGRCYGHLGQYGEAETALRNALQLAAPFPAVFAQAKVQMGVVRWQAGQLDEARIYLEEAESAFKRLGDTRNQANALGNLGMVLHSLGRYQLAIDAMRRALELCESLNNLALVAIQCGNLGECYRDLGDAARAQDLHQRAITLAELLGSEGLQADAWHNLGMDLAALGELDAAVEAIERSMAIAQTYHHLDNYVQSLGALAQVRLQRGEYDEARRLATQLIETAADVALRRAIGQLVIGRCQIACGDAAQGIATLDQGLLDAQQSFSQMLVLRFHAALAGAVTHPGLTEIHRAIARDAARAIADDLTDKSLREVFLASPLVRPLMD